MTSNVHYHPDHELTHSMVHYLFAIHKLKESKGYARVTDIAKLLNLTKGSVSIALTGLKKKKLVQEDDSKFLSLTTRGHEEVHGILSSRTLLYYFFKDVLSLDDQTAHRDSCLMEHLMSDDSRRALFEFLKTIPNLSLNLSVFADFNSFIHGQLGDEVLKS